MADTYLRFGTLDMSAEIEDWEEQGDSRIQAQLVSRRHGIFLSDVPVLDGRYVRVKGAIVATTAELCRTRLDTISEVLHSGVQKLQFLDDRFLIAQKARFGYGYAPGSAGRKINFALEFVCADPFLYRDATSSSSNPISASPTSFSVTNGGTAFVYPKVTFTAGGSSITSISLLNNTTGKTFAYSGTVLATKALVVDTSDFTVLNDGVSDLTNFTGVFPHFNSGSNSYTFTGSNCTILFEWRNRWWT